MRDPGCRGCQAVTSGDCGMHGPMVIGSVTFGPPMPWVGLASELQLARAEIARLAAEVERLKRLLSV